MSASIILYEIGEAVCICVAWNASHIIDAVFPQISQFVEKGTLVFCDTRHCIAGGCVCQRKCCEWCKAFYIIGGHQFSGI